MITKHKRRCRDCGEPSYLPALADPRICWRCAIMPPSAPPAKATRKGGA